MIEQAQHQLRYTADPHGYWWNGEPVPYTSGILKDLGLAGDFSHVDPDRLAVKTAIGKSFHVGAELICRGQDLDPASIDPLVAPYLAALRSFIRDSGIKAIACELPLYAQSWGFATCLDFVGVLNDRLVIVDFKTQTTVSKSVEYQLWAQELAWSNVFHDEIIGARYSLQLKPDEKYRLKEWSRRPANLFSNMLFTWNEKRSMGANTHV